MEPRLPYGTNIAAWWGHLYDDFGKERITIYCIDSASGLARAAFGFDYKTTPRYEQPGIVVPPDHDAREPALADVVVPLRPHFGVGGVAPPEAGGSTAFRPASSAATSTTGASGRARPCTTRCSTGALALLPRRPAHGRGRRRAVWHRHRGLGRRGGAAHRSRKDLRLDDPAARDADATGSPTASTRTLTAAMKAGGAGPADFLVEQRGG